MIINEVYELMYDRKLKDCPNLDDIINKTTSHPKENLIDENIK